MAGPATFRELIVPDGTPHRAVFYALPMASTPREETLWTVTTGTQTASAVIAHLEGVGIELRLLWNGDLRHSQVFRTPTAVEDALAEADARRRDLELRGWHASA